MRWLDGIRLPGRKEGRDETKRLFARYVKDFICLALIPVIMAFALPAYTAMMLTLGTIMIDVILFMHVRLSMRIRRIEERIECQRYV